MLKISVYIVTLFALYHVSYGNDQYYNFVDLVESVGNRLSAHQNLRDAASSAPEILPLLNEYKDFPIDNVIPFLEKVLQLMSNNKCRLDIEYVMRNVNKTMWGISMIDAFGKPSSGFLDGNVKWVGSYYECTHLYVPLDESGTAGDFRGQYCSLETSLEVLDKKVPVIEGICIPETCENELSHFIDTFTILNPTNSTLNITKHTCQPVSKELTPAAIGVIFMLSFFIFLAVIGSAFTVYDYFFERKDRSSSVNADMQTDGSYSDVSLLPDRNQDTGLLADLKTFFSCFCVFSNGEKLLNTDGTEGQLLCLHGIRFLSMSWVIVCHTYAFAFSVVGNYKEIGGLIDGWGFQIILNGFFSVDSFFLLSGFLVAYLFFKESEKSNGKFPWAYFYIHRYIRLTPVYMICLGAYAALFYYMGSGPFNTVDPVEKICKENWWLNILYINNFVKSDRQCMGWAWYLANDMQFFIISPLFLITLYHWPTIGYSMLGLFMSAAFAANFGITYHYDLFSGLSNITTVSDIPGFMARFSEFFDKIYIKPYTRISPYLVGIALAYYMFKRKQNNQGKVSLLTLVVGWILSTAVVLTFLFCLHNNVLTTVENSFYNALSRTGFALGLAWVIFVCLNGQGGPVNDILSFKLFIPLSRLTYCAYLIHPIFIIGYFTALKVPLHFAHFSMVNTFLGMLVVTYVSAFLVSVLFESPIIKLDKLVRTMF